jgi:hypothetical protein
VSATISPPVAALLDQIVIDGFTVRPLPPAEREVYEEFNEVLVRLRGKWKRGKGHVFPYDPTVALQAVRASGVMPTKNPLAYFPTPIDIARGLVAELDAMASGVPRRMLEPSAGSGALIDAVRERWPDIEVVAVEAEPLNAAMLRAKGYTVIEGDFLRIDVAGPFDLVSMNPPFAVDGDRNAWVAHLYRAWDLLDPAFGRLACIAPAGAWRQSERKPFPELRRWMTEVGAWLDVHDAGAFKDSGTGVATLSILARRCSPEARDLDHESELVWLAVDNDRAWHERMGSLLAKPADDASVVAFFRDAVVFANDQGCGGVALTPSLLRVLARDWAETRLAKAQESKAASSGSDLQAIVDELARLEVEAREATAAVFASLASIGFVPAPVREPGSAEIPPEAAAKVGPTAAPGQLGLFE